MENTNKKISVALNSVFWSLFLTLMKGVTGFITGSLGILSEALHSALDLGTALITYFTVRVSDIPADNEHHYGHSKIESISALIETALLFVTSGWIIYEAVKRLFWKGVEVELVWYAFVVVIISIVVDISRSRALMKVAKETKSQALEADALHFSSDIWSSGAVLIGLVCVYFKIPAADTIAALVVAVIVLKTAFNLSKRTFDVLIDKAPEGLEDIVRDIVLSMEGVIGVSKIRARVAGANIFVEISLEVSRKLAQEKVKVIGKNAEDAIKKKIQGADITIHFIPIALSNETLIDHVQILAHNHSLSVHDITVHIIDEKTYINFDLEVSSDKTMKEAHDMATHLEEVLNNELGKDIEVTTHIEPLRSNTVVGEKISKEGEEEIKKQLNDLMNEMSLISETHDVIIRKVDEKIFISFHAYVDGSIMIEDAHEEASRLEYLIKQKIDKVSRAVVHLEPR